MKSEEHKIQNAEDEFEACALRAKFPQAAYDLDVRAWLADPPVQRFLDVYASFDPDEVTQHFTLEGAETRGVPVDTSEYPAGTWFYYGTDYVFVRLPGKDHIARVEARQTLPVAA